MGEPRIHSHIEDSLPDDHPLQYEQVHCSHCSKLVHAANNECMSTWFEFDDVAICAQCVGTLPEYVQGGGNWVDVQ